MRLLGEAVWQRLGQAPVRLAAKDAALLAKLALDGPQARLLLCTLLWPEASAERAADSLRQRASRLNRAAAAPLIETGDPLRLHVQVEVDAAHPAGLDTETLLQAGTLLSGIDLGDLGELDAWLTRARSRMAEACAQALADRAEALERRGRLHDALALARRIVEWLPLDEHGWRRLMRLHYLRADRGAAQAAYWRLHALLRDELGIRPSAETQQMMQTVEAADPAAGQPRHPVPVSVHRPPLLIGREPAWQAMAAAWQAPQPFLLLGEAGMGKTRLLEEFLRGQDGVLADRAQPGDEQSPYALLGRVLVQLDQRYAPALSVPLRCELARLRPEFGPQPQSPTHPAVLWHAIAQLLALAQGQGLRGLVLDDLHNADTATLEALRWLGASPQLSALRIGLASRPALAVDSPLRAWLQDSQRPVRIQLAPLTQQELTALLASLALPSLLDTALCAQLYRHAGGHPLYTLATLHEVYARGSDPQAAPLPSPNNVEALLDARLKDLPATAQDLLRVAAVAGSDLRADLAARLLGRSVLALADAWDQLEAANVLRGEAFSHDLVHDAALRAVPQGVRQALHRQWAALLADQAAAAAARVAWHWEQGEAWSEAGRCWHAAAEAARLAGRLAEQVDLFERAAGCHARVGDDPARFEALHARLGGLLLRHGGSAVLAALPQVQALAGDPLRRLRCRLARAEAWLDGEHAAQAAAEAEAAWQEAALYPALRVEAGALHAQALAQCGRFEPALIAAAAALNAAQADGSPVQRLRALEAMRYVHYADGQLAQAVEWLRREIVQADAIGHRAEVAAGEGNLAALLAAIGDVPGTYRHALHCRERHHAIGLAENSTIGIVNHIVLGASAAALGRFEEALDCLQAAVSMAGAQAAPAARAKARLTLANVWLTLGRADLAQALSEDLPAQIGPGMRMQAAWVRARAALLAGASPQRPLAQLTRLAAEHPNPSLVQSAWFEYSFQGEASEVIARLQGVRLRCEALGLQGTARSLRWRELVRWLEIAGPAATAAALDHAQQLLPLAATGLSAKCHPPQTWLTLSQAFTRAGDAACRDDCHVAATAWLQAALPNVPAEHRASFVRGNPANRVWLGGGAA